MKEIIVLALLLTIAISIGCEKSAGPILVKGSGSSEDILEEAVKHNCRTLRIALGAFASENNGRYPKHTSEDSTMTGKTLIDFLPGRERFINPFTGEPTEPVDRAAANPGEIGYEEHIYGIECTAYTLTGFGRDSVIITISKLDELEAMVIANCLEVQKAIEKFAILNEGIYPVDTSSDCTPCGDDVIALLPNGVMLENPFTKSPCEPIDGWADTPGSTGHRVVECNGVPVGYIINGAGRDIPPYNTIIEITNIGAPGEATVRANCFFLREVIYDFIRHNNGEYPNDVGSDTNNNGDTVIDLLDDIWFEDNCIPNPFTQSCEYPVDGRASSSGQIGYEVITKDNVNIGCIITGVGAVPDSVIIEMDSNTYSCD